MPYISTVLADGQLQDVTKSVVNEGHHCDDQRYKKRNVMEQDGSQWKIEGGMDL